MKHIFTLFFVLLSIFSEAQDTLIQQTIPIAPHPFSATKIRNDLHIDASGNYWLAFEKSGLGKFNGSSWSFFDTIGNVLPVLKVNHVTTDIAGNIFAGTSAGLSVFNGTNWQHFNSSNSSLPASGVTTVETNGIDTWIGTNTGIYKYTIGSFTIPPVLMSLTIHPITCIAFGINGEIFTGTTNGIYKYLGSFTSIPTSSLPSQYISDIAVNGSNELWVSDTLGNLFYRDSVTFIYKSIIDLLPHTDQGCAVFSNFSGTSTIEQIGPDILLVFGNDIRSIQGNILFLRINQQHQISYIPCFVGAPITHFTFAFNNNRFSLLQYSGIGGISTRFYTADLTGVNFKLLPTSIVDTLNLNINQIKARINNNGSMHWNPNDNLTVIYEVPACSGKNTVFASGIWIGGYDQVNVLHTAASTYNQQGSFDFWAGPLDTINGSIDSVTVAKYDRTWKVNRSTIDEFNLNYQLGNVTNGSYIVPEVILNWPAKGTGNYSKSLAPFLDINNDGNYNPYDGDYPVIDGDEEIWWVFNDAYKPHTETYGPAFGFEIQAKAYAYNCNAPTIDNEVINYTTFYQYKIINRSGTAYNNIYIGLWTDVDLGNATDDYVGCNVSLHTGFVFNGDSLDQGAWGYGIHPPVQNVTVLKGPLADLNDGLDNNFNGNIDESGETNSMNHFIYIQKHISNCCGLPTFTDDYYQYMDAYWLDGVPFTYGGDARGGGNGATNIPCNFMLPGTTDAGFTTNWTLATAGIPPTDMRMLLSSGKFSIAPGETRTIDFAYITTWDSTSYDPWGAVNTNEIRKVLYWFDNGLLSSCPPPVPVGIIENNSLPLKLNIRPNPVHDKLMIDNIKIEDDYIYTVTDITGKVFSTARLLKNEIGTGKLTPGVYLLRIENTKETRIAKFVKL